MKKLILALLIVSASITSVLSQNVTGTIYYENGKTIKFFEILSIIHEIKNEHPALSSIRNGLSVSYQGKIRKIPYDKIKSIEIMHYGSISDGWSGTSVYDVSAEVKTKTDITLHLNYKYFNFLTVIIYDDLTGGKKREFIHFGENDKLNIRKIVFD